MNPIKTTTTLISKVKYERYLGDETFKTDYYKAVFKPQMVDLIEYNLLK